MCIRQVRGLHSFKNSTIAIIGENKNSALRWSFISVCMAVFYCSRHKKIVAVSVLAVLIGMYVFKFLKKLVLFVMT